MTVVDYSQEFLVVDNRVVFLCGIDITDAPIMIKQECRTAV